MAASRSSGERVRRVSLGARLKLGSAALVELVVGLEGAPPCEVLGIPPDSATEVARSSYRKHALLLHPDKNSHALCEEAFKVVSDAFGTLQRQRSRWRSEVAETPNSREKVNRWEAFTSDTPRTEQQSHGAGGAPRAPPPSSASAAADSGPNNLNQAAFQAARAAWGARAGKGRPQRANAAAAVPPCESFPTDVNAAFTSFSSCRPQPPQQHPHATRGEDQVTGAAEPRATHRTQRGAKAAWSRPKKRSVLSAFPPTVVAPPNVASSERHAEHKCSGGDDGGGGGESQRVRGGGGMVVEEREGFWDSLYEGFVGGSDSGSGDDCDDGGVFAEAGPAAPAAGAAPSHEEQESSGVESLPSPQPAREQVRSKLDEILQEEERAGTSALARLAASRPKQQRRGWKRLRRGGRRAGPSTAKGVKGHVASKGGGGHSGKQQTMLSFI